LTLDGDERLTQYPPSPRSTPHDGFNYRLQRRLAGANFDRALDLDNRAVRAAWSVAPLKRVAPLTP
jgi:hypothetical protein